MGDEADPNKYKALITDQRKNMKIAYERVKQKARDIRQEYRIAVTQGTRFGSSRVVYENWEQLKILWGGSAAAVCLTNCRTTILHAEKQSDFNEHDEMNECNEGMHDDGEGVTQNRNGSVEDILESASDNSPSVLNLVKQQRVSNKNHKRKNADGTVQTFVDNKRKQLEKNVSAAQRDQMFLKLAKDELKMKETMVASLGESATQTSKTMEKIAESISSFGKALGDGLAMIAMAMAPPQRQQVPSTPQASRMQMSSSYPSSSYLSPIQVLNVLRSIQHSFYGNMTGTTLQETGERCQNL